MHLFLNYLNLVSSPCQTLLFILITSSSRENLHIKYNNNWCFLGELAVRHRIKCFARISPSDPKRKKQFVHRMLLMVNIKQREHWQNSPAQTAQASRWSKAFLCIASLKHYSEFPPARPLAYNAEHVKSGHSSPSLHQRTERHAVSPVFHSSPEVKELWLEVPRG